MNEVYECGVYSKYSGTSVPLKSVDIKCNVISIFSDVTSFFTYENDSDELNGVEFTFPLNNVAVYNFEARIGDKKIVAECRHRTEAKDTYDEAVKEGHTAVLAEQNEHCDDVFQMSLGNIPSKEKILILLKYVGLLEADNMKGEDGKFSYSHIVFTLPTAINPRYHPSEEKISSEYDVFVPSVAYNSQSYTMSFEANLKMPYDVLEVSSVHDRFVLQHLSNSKSCAHVKLASKFDATHDFQMVIKMKEPLESSAAIEFGDANKSGLLSMNCVMAQFLPNFSDVSSEKETRNELVFVIDRSGSMSGNRIEYAKSSLLLFLKSLPTTCRFQIIGFGSTHSSLFHEPVDYNENTVNRALEYQKNLEADMGGTEVYGALSNAFEAPLSGQGWYRNIIFLTDGDVSNADEVLGLIHMNVKKARVFAIGLGEGASTTLVSGVARAGRGIAAFVRDNSHLHGAVMKILQNALQPRANNVKVEWELYECVDGDSSDQKKMLNILHVPQEIPPVFFGNYLTCFGFYKSDSNSKIGGNVRLSFELMGEMKSLDLDVSKCLLVEHLDSDKDLPIHRLGGKSQIQELLDKYHSIMLIDASNSPESKNPGESESVRKQIEDLSCQINMLTKFTSLVGIDPDKPPKFVQDTPTHDYGVFGLSRKSLCCASVPCGNFFAPPNFSSQTSFMRSSGGGNFFAPPNFSSQTSFMRSSGADQNSFLSDCSFKCADMVDGFNSKISAFTPNAESSTESSVPMEKHVQLAALQNFLGFWKLDSALCDCLEIKMDQVSPRLKEKWNSISLTDLTWGTALVIAFLESRMDSHKNEWILMVEKARKWLSEQLCKQSMDNHKFDDQICNDLIEEAKACLK